MAAISAESEPAVEPREQAVQAVYESDVRGGMDLASRTDLTTRARRLAKGVIEDQPHLDAAIDAASEHWRVDRMPVVDRAVLRVALYELRNEPDTPTAVILNEAVRIAKHFSTEKSGTFVNGVLSTLAHRERG